MKKKFSMNMSNSVTIIMNEVYFLFVVKRKKSFFFVFLFPKPKKMVDSIQKRVLCSFRTRWCWARGTSAGWAWPRRASRSRCRSSISSCRGKSRGRWLGEDERLGERSKWPRERLRWFPEPRPRRILPEEAVRAELRVRSRRFGRRSRQAKII